MAQVPKSAMYWYCVSRSMAFWMMRLSRRKTGPWLGSRNSASSSQDALQRLDEVRDVGAVMGVDDADAAVLVDVVAAEEQVAHLEAELARRCGPACARPSSFRSPTVIDVAFVEQHVDLAAAASGCRCPGP